MTHPTMTISIFDPFVALQAQSGVVVSGVVSGVKVKKGPLVVVVGGEVFSVDNVDVVSCDVQLSELEEVSSVVLDPVVGAEVDSDVEVDVEVLGFQVIDVGKILLSPILDFFPLRQTQICYILIEKPLRSGLGSNICRSNIRPDLNLQYRSGADPFSYTAGN